MMQERIKALINSLNISIAKFERSLGWGTAYVYKIQDSLPSHKIDEILKVYTNVNREWLETGNGDMFISQPQNNSTVNVTIENSNIASVDNAHNCNIYNGVAGGHKEAEPNTGNENVLGSKDGCLIKVDMMSINKDIRLRDYCLNHCDHDFDIRKLVPQFTFIYQIRTRLLEPCVFQGDWLCVHLVQDRRDLVSGKVYLIDCPEHGRMVKRFEETADCYILSLPVTRKDYPILQVPKDHPMDFYEIVSRISNDVGSIFSENTADFHHLAVTAIDSTNHLIKVLEKVIADKQ